MVSGDSESVLNGKTRVGFIAQELQNATPDNENDILDLVYDVNPERIEAKYGNLIPGLKLMPSKIFLLLQLSL